MIQPQRAMAKSPALHKIEDTKQRRRSADIGWQTDAYELAREVGEAGYVMHLTANTLSMCDFLPRRDVGEGMEADTDERPVEVMAALVGPRGGVKEVYRRIALHASIAGEWYLVGLTVDDGGDNGILWEALSVRELEINTAGDVTRRRDGSLRETIDEDSDAYLARGWISDAEFSDRADSQMRRALPACREVAVHSQVIDATGRSKVAAGILFIPEEMSFGAEEEDLSDEDMMDALSQEVLEHLSAPIVDRENQASYVPLVMRGPAEHGQAIRLIEIGKSYDQAAIELRDKALARVLRMLDIPPELVDGKGGMSHWGSYNVDHEFLVAHVQPLGEMIAEFLTAAYLRPMLEAFYDMSPEEAAEWTLDFDMSKVTTRKDAEASARALGDRDKISDDAILRAHGFEPADKPTDEENKARIAMRLIQQQINLAPVLLPFVPGFEDVDMAPIKEALAAAQQQAAEPAASETPKKPEDDIVDAESGSEEPDQAEQREPTASEAGQLVTRVAVAADAALERALERGASRLINQSKSDRTIKDRLAGVDKVEAFQLVGPTELSTLGLSATALFAGSWDTFSPKARRWIREWSETTNHLSAPVADDLAALAVSELCDRLESWMFMHLHRGVPLGANGLRVPDELVEDALSLVLGPVVAR